MTTSRQAKKAQTTLFIRDLQVRFTRSIREIENQFQLTPPEQVLLSRVRTKFEQAIIYAYGRALDRMEKD